MTTQGLHVLRQPGHLLRDLGLGTAQVHHQATLLQEGRNLGQLADDDTHGSRQDDHVGLTDAFGDIGRPPIHQSQPRRRFDRLCTARYPNHGATLSLEGTRQRAPHQPQAHDGDMAILQPAGHGHSSRPTAWAMILRLAISSAKVSGLSDWAPSERA